jgi:basic membrane protein A and related proteins
MKWETTSHMSKLSKVLRPCDVLGDQALTRLRSPNLINPGGDHVINSRHRLVVASTLAASLVAAACGSDKKAEPAAEVTTAPVTTVAPAPAATDAPAPTEAPTATAAPAGTDAPAPAKAIKVAMLFDLGGRGDKSFNDSAAEGLDKAKADLGIETVEFAANDSNRAELATTAAEGGADLIIGVGFLWGDALTAAADAYPDIKFAIVDSVIEKPNVASLVFSEQEGSFLVGAAAALKSKTGSIGFIGGVENDLIKRFEAGYTAGAKAVNADIKVDVKYISQPPDFSGFGDPAKGKEIALAQYEAGADVIYSAAGSSGLGGFEAAKEKKLFAIGVDSDQYNLVAADTQPYIITSMLKKVDVAVYEVIKGAASGSMKAGVNVFDLKSGGLDYATSGGQMDDIKAQLDAFKADIISGKVKVPAAP